MKKVTGKKIARKIARFCAHLSKDMSVNLLDNFSPSPSNVLCLINAGLLNGFTREEILDIFENFGDIENLIMLEGKSYCVLSFKKEKYAAESYQKLNGSFCLKDESKPLYLCFLKCIDDTLLSFQETSKVWPTGLILKENFISLQEEEKLLFFTHTQQSESQTSQLKHRTVKHYGFEFQYGSNKVDKNPLSSGIPVEMEPLIEKFLEFGLARPNQLTVNHYVPGQGIPLHTDTHSSFEDEIISVSLGSDIVMDFKNTKGGECASITLPRRSCLIMTNESRYIWSHGITPRKSDVVDAELGGLTILRREKRTSLTFRKIRTSEKCDCKFTEWCDSLSSKIADFSEETADQIEKNHVFPVYDGIASHFSETRHSPWPNVKAFIMSFPVGSLLADIGCGNGKYFNCSSSLFSIGTDRSSQLLKICRNRHDHQVVKADCRVSPFRDSIADAAICIAVIHHLTTEERRLKTLIDISRVVVKGGRALIYVWDRDQQIGMEKSSYLLQKKSEVSSRAEAYPTAVLPVHENRTNFKHADILVPWKLNFQNSNSEEVENRGSSESFPSTYLRFYHVFREGELEYLCSKVSNITVFRSFYDQGNWCVEFKKE